MNLVDGYSQKVAFSDLKVGNEYTLERYEVIYFVKLVRIINDDILNFEISPFSNDAENYIQGRAILSYNALKYLIPITTTD